MTDTARVLAVFCEGAHDIAFISRVLKYCMGFKRDQTLRINEFPAPFDSLFDESVKSHAVDDLKLDMARKFFLPDQVMRKGTDWILLFNSGGDTQQAKIQSFLADLLPLAESAQAFAKPGSTVAQSIDYLFIFDVDTKGVLHRVNKMHNDFAQIELKQFEEDEPTPPEFMPFISGDFVASQSPYGYTFENKALYVWGETTEKGTLEDWLIPMFKSKQPANLSTAYAALDEMFEWGDKNSVAKQSKRHKTAITLLGQGKKPGSSMAVIVEQAELLTKADYKQSPHVQDLVQFIHQWAPFNNQ